MDTSAESMNETLAQLQERVGPQIEQAKEKLEVWNQQAMKVMRERPGTCLIVAIGAGFLIGRMVSRR